ncbi:MAG: hypothetical protein L6Q35_04805 [Phycisphaerales bacterium]|nr:hypothetical protein [Phycisphaerales bacterium]
MADAPGVSCSVADSSQRLELSAPDSLINAELHRMRGDLRPLVRPVVVLGGWRSPHFMAGALARRIRSLTSGDRGDFLCVSYPLAASVESAASAVRRRLGRWRPDSPGLREVDVVAISMGGLVARYIASHPREYSEVRICRLFTFSTPHAGAMLARWIRPDRAAAAMMPGSPLIQQLHEACGDPARAPEEIVCYVQRLDWWIGTWNAAPPGHELRWVRTRGPFSAAFSHFSSHRHPTLIVDVARRLRGEPGLDQVTSAA